MMILSEGGRRAGAIQRLETTVAAYTGENEHKQLGATVGLVGTLSGIINNTAAVAVDAATRSNANAFAFVLAVTFAASTAFISPVGYQTNLFVYGPGGYEFSDYVRVGGPLQVILAVVTTIGIAAFWGL